jgi:hypothetical protein
VNRNWAFRKALHLALPAQSPVPPIHNWNEAEISQRVRPNYEPQKQSDDHRFRTRLVTDCLWPLARFHLIGWKLKPRKINLDFKPETLTMPEAHREPEPVGLPGHAEPLIREEARPIAMNEIDKRFLGKMRSEYGATGEALGPVAIDIMQAVDWLKNGSGFVHGLVIWAGAVGRSVSLRCLRALHQERARRLISLTGR